MGSKSPADERPLTADVTSHVSARERRGFQKRTRGFLVCQERLDFVPERVIAGAQFGQHGRPLGLRSRHDGAVDALDLRPAFRHPIARNGAYLTRALSPPTELAKEPHLGQSPIAQDRARRHLQRIGRLLDAQSAEIPHLDDLALSWVHD